MMQETISLNSIINKVLKGDSYQVLKSIQDNTVHFTFTSPPYLGVRDYGIDGQLGKEEYSDTFLDKMNNVFDEIYRITTPTGVCWVNFGDTFAGSKIGNTNGTDGEVIQKAGVNDMEINKKTPDYPDKCIMMIPERFAERMITTKWKIREDLSESQVSNVVHELYKNKLNSLELHPKRIPKDLREFFTPIRKYGSWILRAKVVWYKPNGMIESSKDRPKLDYEFLYMFSKQQTYWFNYLEAKKPLKTVTKKRNKYALKEIGRLEGNSAKHGLVSTYFESPEEYQPPAGGTKHSGNNGRATYSGKPVKVTDGMAKIGSVWGLPPESIWSIAPKTFGHELCAKCDKLVKSRLLKFKCVDDPKTGRKGCGTVYGKLNPAEILRANNLDPEAECPVCQRSLKRHLTLNGKGRLEGLQPEVIDCGYFDLPELQNVGCPNCGNRKRDPVCPVCHEKVHMHFAMFPEELVEPAIRMSCPDQVCSKCGVPRFPIYTPTEEYAKLLGKGWHEHNNDDSAGQMQEKVLPAAKADYRIKEWTDCGCGAPFESAIGCDPFSGWFTVGAALLKAGRRCIGIELHPLNVRAGELRIETLQLSSKKKVNVGISQARLF